MHLVAPRRPGRVERERAERLDEGELLLWMPATGRLAGMVLLGAVAGLGIGLWLGRFVQTLLFQIRATDSGALAPPVIALAAAALLAVLPPVIRAVRTDPARTIRTEG